MPSIEKAYEKYDGIIIGQVDEIVRRTESNEIKIKVLRSFKEMDEEKISAKEDAFWSSLHGPSIQGTNYLFFLRKTENGLEHPLCSPTKQVNNASDELVFLQDKEIPLKAAQNPPTPDRHAEKLARAAQGEAEWHVIPEMTHILKKTTETLHMLTLIKTYKKMGGEPIAPELLDLLIAWLRKYFGGEGK